MTDTPITDAPHLIITPTPTPAPATTPVKPGWKTSEFYLALFAKLLGALFASGLLGDGSALYRLCGLAAIVLTSLGYTVSRTVIKTAATMLVVFVFASHSMGCAASGREKTLQTIVAVTDAAKVAFVLYDGKHQHDIIIKGPDEQTSEKLLHEWRGTQLTIEQDFSDVYHAIATAAIANDNASLTSAITTQTNLTRTLTSMGVKL
jgi:hypothetical protein